MRQQVVAMQFAGGMSIARLAKDWEQSQEWVEDAIRQELLKQIPQRMGGLKPLRADIRAARSEYRAELAEAQKVIDFDV